MVQLLNVVLSLTGLLALTTAVPHKSGYHHNSTHPPCVAKTSRKPWQMLTRQEQDGYIDATLCLMKKPSKLNIDGAHTRWDDLLWTHIVQANVIHGVGHFLPWHRYYVTIHGHLLRDECGYQGPLPYWDEPADADLSSLLDSPIFQVDTFGGDGAGNPGSQITTGPFAHYKLYLNRVGEPLRKTGITRHLDVTDLYGVTQDYLDECLLKPTYALAWICWHDSPHASGHEAIGGLNWDIALGPGDPLFYLHHGWLDAMWWKWQSLQLPARLADISGPAVAGKYFLLGHELTEPGPEWTDYDGDEYDTTLVHVLYAGGVAPNITARDVMDPRTGIVCAEFFYSNSFTVPPGA